MNRNLKILAAATLLLGLVMYAGAIAESRPAPDTTRAPNAGTHSPDARPSVAPPAAPRGADGSGRLTETQQKRVATILTQYKADALTRADAQAMNEAFRDAGIRRGPGLKAAIEAVGFDTGKISALYPPPEKAGGRHLPDAGRTKHLNKSPRSGSPDRKNMGN